MMLSCSSAQKQEFFSCCDPDELLLLLRFMANIMDEYVVFPKDRLFSITI